ncbi:hypothetical protein EIN_209050 [Entamoeba invadens IP1]|uniref:Leucine rich repeat containing protein BspA family protein n=1 Tax=Entamoeba invadens IP1 TaxID=370355 RepID=L7FNL3_ENTIV|nr:hypothetical protein EIN_209050 [Entamoeba invadens IP1]ELP94506.1 hypothetical protein EIN_209050 [Entamoeba invadens IP1]|eukprot:XP_004261277.1 hypothetical protein EIN_209050 [Entamoeba invadens IP1]
MIQLDGYHIMIVSQYFSTIDDFINLELVCKKFRGNMAKFHYNPIPLSLVTIEYFPNIETLHLWSNEDEEFGSILYEELGYYDPELATKKFYKVIIWYSVNYLTYFQNTDRNIKFHGVTYTQYDRELLGYKIPNDVQTIGTYCFHECLDLKGIQIPHNITCLESWCFSGCGYLVEITIPSSVSSIGEGCFNGCGSLSKLVIQPGITTLPKCCFKQCFALKTLVIPFTVVSIEDQCFQFCGRLSSVVISNTVTSIGNECFNMCKSLLNINLPIHLTLIGDKYQKYRFEYIKVNISTLFRSNPYFFLFKLEKNTVKPRLFPFLLF